MQQATLQDQDILSREFNKTRLFREWEIVAQKSSVAGVDGVRVEDFSRNCNERLNRLHDEIVSRKYQPQPALLFPKQKTDGSGAVRMLSILTVRDRIVARSAADLLSKRFDSKLQPQSYAYRRGKGALKAVSVVQRALPECTHVVRADIQDFFDTINYEILRETLARLGLDAPVNDTVLTCATQPRFDGVELQQPKRGIPQGSPLAPVLSNLYLNPLDRALNQEHLRFVRYADDLLVLARNPDEASMALRLIQEQIQLLKVDLAQDKSRIYCVDHGFVFLGFLFNRNGKTPCKEARERLERKLHNSEFDDDVDNDTEQRRKAIQRGWENYYGAANSAETRDNAPVSVQAQRGVIVEDEESVESTLASCRDLLDGGRFSEASHILRRLTGNDLVEKTDEENRSLMLLLAEVYDCQGMHGAAIKCRETAGVKQPPNHSSESGDAGARRTFVFGKVQVDSWVEMFGGSSKPVYRQYVDRVGRCGYRPASETLSAAYLRDHWKQRHTLAVPVFVDSSRVHFAVVDLDVTRNVLDRLDAKALADKRELVLQDALNVLDTAHRAGVDGVLEDSGFKGYHAWFFFHEPLQAKGVRDFIKALLNVCGEPPEGTHREVFPGSDSPKQDAVGMRIKLPLGLHRISGRTSKFLAPNGSECDFLQQLDMLRIRVRANSLRQAQSQFHQSMMLNEKDMKPDDSKGSNERSDIAVLYQKCVVLRALRDKAKSTGSLAHAERAVLRGILAPLGPDGCAEVHTILGHCDNYSHSVTERMLHASAGKHPMGCRRVREILDGLCSDLTCHCRFKPKKGDYAHPLRHLALSSVQAGIHGNPRKNPEPIAVDSHEAEGGDIQTAVTDSAAIMEAIQTYRQARQQLLKAQKQLNKVVDGDLRKELPFGVLTRGEPDPELFRWIVEV